jgi:tRNA (guanine26-N2/guanine27-N2)-dimethyltransferase
MPSTTEGAATIITSAENKISKELETFYNPIMQCNRDMSIALLKARKQAHMRIADPLAGSGIRAIRFVKELPPEMIEHIAINDCKLGSAKVITHNFSLSSCSLEKISIHEQDANLFLLTEPSFDYIDIDPFGSPNPFLDIAIKKTKRNGVLAVTATDTAPLCGTYPKACARKYYAKPRRDYLMHEYGLRILVRKCQLIGAQYDKALVPIFSYSKDHYFRIFFTIQPGKKNVDAVLAQHAKIEEYGPLWIGKLSDSNLIKEMLAFTPETHQSFLNTIAQENSIDTVGFYDIHHLSEELHLPGPPKTELILTKLAEKKYPCSRTHFSPLGIKTSADKDTMKRIMHEVSS